MTGGLKKLFFFFQVYIYLTLFKYMYAYGKQIHLTLSHQLVPKPHHLDEIHRVLDKPHKSRLGQEMESLCGGSAHRFMALWFTKSTFIPLRIQMKDLCYNRGLRYKCGLVFCRIGLNYLTIYARKDCIIMTTYILCWQDSLQCFVAQSRCSTVSVWEWSRGTNPTSDIPSLLTPNMLSQPQILSRQKPS